MSSPKAGICDSNWSQIHRSRKQLIGNSFEWLDLKQFWKITANEVSIQKFNWKTKMLHIIGIEDKPHSQYTCMCMQVSDFIKAKLSLAMIYRQFAMPDQIHCIFRGTYGKNHLVRCHKTTNVCVRTQAFSISFCWISEFSDHISTGQTTNGTPDGVERYVFPSNKFLLNKINNRSVYTKLFIQNYATHSLAQSNWKQRLDIRQKNIKFRYAARVKCWQKIKITKHTKWFCFLFLSLVQIENGNRFIS